MAPASHPARNVILITIVVVTAIVVALVVSSGEDDSVDQAVVTLPPSTTTTSAPPTTEAPAPATTSTTIALPPGDYTAMCGELEVLAAIYGTNPTIDGFRQLFETLDFEALIAASTDGMRPYVETLRDLRPQVLAVLETTQQVEDLQASALPLTFYDSLQHLVAVVEQRCTFPTG